MTLQLLHSEFAYIWGKFDFLFFISVAVLLARKEGRTPVWAWAATKIQEEQECELKRNHKRKIGGGGGGWGLLWRKQEPKNWFQVIIPPSFLARAGIFIQSMGARKRVGIAYRTVNVDCVKFEYVVLAKYHHMLIFKFDLLTKQHILILCKKLL